MPELFFISPTKGRIDYGAMIADILSYIASDPDSPHKLIVGTDSQVTREEVVFVTAVVCHRVGKGARFYYQKEHRRPIRSLRQRIFYEVSLSLQLAGRVAGDMAKAGSTVNNLEIHLDIGQQGASSELIREIVGMVSGSGFDAKIKPDSFGASKVADKFTK